MGVLPYRSSYRVMAWRLVRNARLWDEPETHLRNGFTRTLIDISHIRTLKRDDTTFRLGDQRALSSIPIPVKDRLVVLVGSNGPVHE